MLIDRDEVAKGASFGNAGAFAFSDMCCRSRRLDPPPGSEVADRSIGALTIRPSYRSTITPWLMRFWRASWRSRLEASKQGADRANATGLKAVATLATATDVARMIRSDGALELYESEDHRASLPGWIVRPTRRSHLNT